MGSAPAVHDCEKQEKARKADERFAAETAAYEARPRFELIKARDLESKGACRTKLHRERRRRWRLGWSRRGSASAVSWSLARARVGRTTEMIADPKRKPHQD